MAISYRFGYRGYDYSLLATQVHCAKNFYTMCGIHLKSWATLAKIARFDMTSRFEVAKGPAGPNKDCTGSGQNVLPYTFLITVSTCLKEIFKKCFTLPLTA